MSRPFPRLRRPRISFIGARVCMSKDQILFVAMGLFCMNVFGAFVVTGQQIPSPHDDLGRGLGRGLGREAPTGSGGLCESPLLLLNADGDTYENAYAWRYGGVVPPDYGAFAERYTTLGEALVCSIVLDLTSTGLQHGQTLHAFLWDDAGGEPGAVREARFFVDPGPIAFWPSVSRHTIELESPTAPSSTWWVGYWGNWPGAVQGWWMAADLDGPGGHPFTKIAPGIGYPTGWQDVSVVWGPTQALGIGALVMSADLGACCLEDGTCIYSDPDNCEGTFMGTDSVCEPNPCPQPPDGACCFADGSCVVYTAERCEAEGGAYEGDDTGCEPNPCPQPPDGACCFADGSCVVHTAERCEAEGGAYEGDDTGCAPNPCPQPPDGACCLPNENCLFVNRYLCEENGGDYLGDGVVCSPNPCATGACCFADGSCLVLTAGRCEADGGTYEGDDTGCDAPNPCPQPPDGACCFPNGDCVFMNQYLCEENGGAYLGDGVVCSPNPCPVPAEGACCLVDGSCIIRDADTCEQQDGVYYGDSVPCTPNPCPEPGFGACCFENGTCLNRFDYQCEQAGGYFLGDGTLCATSDCPTVCDDFAGRSVIEAPSKNSAAGSGPNAGGTLIFHHNTELEFTVIGEYCGTSELERCSDALPRVETEQPVVFHALAAFRTGSSPRLAGITFGISYPSCIIVLDAGHCGELEIPDTDWPESGSGTAVTWGTPQTTVVTEVYWFGAYIDGMQQARMRLTPHPTQGGQFGDDDVPSNLDPIAAYGEIGFFMPGHVPCPGGGDPESGACCLEDGSCIRLTAEDCLLADGEYQGDGVLCENTNCVSSDVGACCFPNGECLVMSRAACEAAGGDYMGGGTDCAIPCETIPTIESSWGSIKVHFGRE